MTLGLTETNLPKSSDALRCVQVHSLCALGCPGHHPECCCPRPLHAGRNRVSSRIVRFFFAKETSDDTFMASHILL